jgi:hypothetical protein
MADSSFTTQLSATRQLRHIIGVAALMHWMDRLRQDQDAVQRDEQVITLGEQPSARFALALPRSRMFGQALALVCQPDEAEWMIPIKWARAQRVPEGLALVAQRQLGVGDLPSLPAFALILRLEGDARDRLPWDKLDRLDLRRIWQDGDRWQIEGQKPFQGLPMTPAGRPLFEKDDMRQGATFQEIVRQRAMKGAVASNPGYKGQAADTRQFTPDFFVQPSVAPDHPDLYEGTPTASNVRASS